MGEYSKAGDSFPVSIVGYSLRAPNASSVHEFAEALKEGRDLTTSDTRYPCGLHGLPPRQGRISDEDLMEMNPVFFGMSRKLAEKMDPALRVLLKVTYEALMDANIDIHSIRGSRTGVYAGHCFCGVMR
jgi:acyl transferase domain-containing protein